jgi:hypothetical protein
MGDLLRRIMRRFGRLDWPRQRLDLRQVDERIDSLEREQDRIEARLLLLERQSDPRGLRRG